MKFKLKDLISIKHGYAFKGEDFSDQPTQLQILTPGNVTIGGGFQFGKGKWLSLTTEYPKEYEFKAGDMFVSMTDLSKAGDTLGYPAIIPVSDRVMLHNQRLGRVEVLPNVEEVVLKKYLYYAMRTREYHAYIVSGATGTTVRHTSPSKILDYEFDLPSYQEQQRIVGILSPIEDKINVLNDVNDNLLELGRAQFKNITATATTEKLQDMATIVMGQSPKSDTYNNEDIGLPLLNGAADFKGRVVSPNKWTSDPKKVTEPGDYVFGVRATLGLTTKVFEEYAIGRGTGVARSKSKMLDEYLYFVLDDMFNFFEATATGSVYLNVSANDFKNYQAPVVSDAVLEKFHKFARPIMDQFYTNKAEIISLAQMRDVLLGKLVN